MISTELTSEEILELYNEINGLYDAENKVVILKGLLDYEFSAILIKRLMELSNKIKPIKEVTENTRKEIIKRLGEKADGKDEYFVSPKIVKEGVEVDNPNHLKCIEELTALSKDIDTVEHHEFTLNDMDFKVKGRYPVFLMKIIKD